MAATIKTNTTDERREGNGVYVWEKHIEFVTPNATHAAQIANIPINGVLQKIIVVCPATQATGKTFTFTIDDDNDVEIFALGATAENDTYIYNVTEPLNGVIDITIDFNASVGTTDHTLSLYLRGV